MNRNKYKISRRALLAISGLFAAPLITVGNAEASDAPISEVQVGRYQSVVLQADENQVDLLSSMVELELPEQIKHRCQRKESALPNFWHRHRFLCLHLLPPIQKRPAGRWGQSPGDTPVRPEVPVPAASSWAPVVAALVAMAVRTKTPGRVLPAIEQQALIAAPLDC